MGQLRRPAPGRLAMPGVIQGLQLWWSGRPAALRLAAEGAVLALAGAATAALPRIPQPASYHAFADQRPWLGIPHALNTLSNAAMAVPGAVGLWLILRHRRAALRHLSTAEAVCWAATCLCMMGGEPGGRRGDPGPVATGFQLVPP